MFSQKGQTKSSVDDDDYDDDNDDTVISSSIQHYIGCIMGIFSCFSPFFFKIWLQNGFNQATIKALFWNFNYQLIDLSRIAERSCN